MGPGVSDNLTANNTFGVLLANVELEKIFEGKTMEIQNLYYDFGKWVLTRSAKYVLNKVITLMKDNPNLTLELGSHTDSRSSTNFNLDLSEKRVESAVQYLILNGEISDSRIVSKGYGEELLLNKCADGVKCTETGHAINRRTEFKIVGITDMKNVKSLAQMKKEEQLEAEILGLMDQEQVQAKNEEELKKIIAEKGEMGEMRKESGGNLHSATDGVKVVVYQSTSLLNEDHFVFMRHQNIELYDNGDGKTYYMVGGFASESEAFKFMNSYITPDKKYKDPLVVKFTNGILAVENQ